MRWSSALKRDDHIPSAPSRACVTVDASRLGASWPQRGVQRSAVCLCFWPANASVSVPTCHTCTGSCVWSLATSAFVSLSVGEWSLPRCKCVSDSWRKQNVDTTRIPPGRVPSGRPIECTLACWVPLGPNKGCIGRPYAFAPGLPTRQSLCPPVIFARSWRNFSCSKRKHDVDATSTPPGREPPGRPIASTVPHLLIDSRPGPKSGVECRLMILLLLLHCHVFHSVRVPALSVGAGEGNLLAHQRRLEVPKLNGDQVTHGKQVPTHLWNPCVKRSVARACNRAIRHGQALSLYLCTFRFLQIPEEGLAADHLCPVPNADRKPAAATYPIPGWDGPRWDPAPRMLRDAVWFLTLRPTRLQLVSARKLRSGDCLVPNADRKPAAATYPILGWDGPHWGPAPRMLRDVVWILTRHTRSQFVRARKLRDALRPDLPWVLNHTVLSVPPQATRSSQVYRCFTWSSVYAFVQRNTTTSARCHNRWLQRCQ